nr:MAG TPA: hypothetical protein [Caudoviricetes sp.]
MRISSPPDFCRGKVRASTREKKIFEKIFKRLAYETQAC